MLFEWSNRMIGADDPEFEGGDEGAHAASATLYAYVERPRRSSARATRATTSSPSSSTPRSTASKLSELEFDMFMLLLTVAGNETTRNTTARGMWALMQHPEQYALAARRPRHALDPAVEEILRWASPVYHFRRTATARPSSTARRSPRATRS